MITERRQIVFSNQMVIRALAEFDRDHEQQFPPKKTITCVINGDGEVRATLNFGTLAEPAQKSIEVETNRLAAVLIGLPRRAICVAHLASDQRQPAQKDAECASCRSR